MLKSISARIVVLFLLIVLVPLVIFGTCFSVNHYISLREQLASDQGNEAERLAQNLIVYLDDLVNELELISNILSFQGGDDAHKFILLKSLQIFQPLFEELAFIDSEGNKLSVRKRGDEILLNNRQQNKDTLDKVKLAQRSLASVIRNPDKPSARLLITSPIFFLDKSYINGAVSANASIAALCKFVNHYSQASDLQAGLLFQDGTRVNAKSLFAPSPDELHKAFAGLAQAKGYIVDGNVIGISPLSFDDVELYVVLSSDVSKQMVPFFQSLKIFLFILLMILVAAVLTGVFFAKRLLLSPLSALSRAAGEIRDGDLGKRVELSGDSEFTELADTFNSMANELEKSLDALKVESTQRREAEWKSRKLMTLAQEASEAKSLFLANMSHEIRTPINGIMGMTSLMLSSDLSDEQRHRMKLVSRSTRRLLNIITGILDFSKIEAGEVDLDSVRFDLRQLVQDALELVQHEINRDKIKLSSSVDDIIPLELFADAGKIYQVVLNLLSNAIKHTVSGAITVHATLLDAEDEIETVQICVSDTGSGVDDSARETLFAPFSQVEAGQATGREGAGLGLAICEQFVTLMEGDIWFENNVSGGCSFYFSCKCKRVGGGASAEGLQYRQVPKDASQLSLNGISIYIAEDEYINQHMLSSYLTERGAKVLLCDNGQELLDAMEHGQPDVILMDIKMPVMDGLEATMRIREMEKKMGSQPVSIIALTAHATKDFMKKCFASGMDDYLTKPIELEGLIEIIVALCRK